VQVKKRKYSRYFCNKSATDCKTIPGISDHEAVLVMSNVSVKMQPPVTRKIFLWWKANFDTIKEKFNNFLILTFQNFPMINL